MEISPADKREHILKQAFADLLSNVERAFTQEPEATGASNDRERYAAALIAVAQFFKKFEAPFGDRFFELGSALADLNIGTVAPLLRAVRTGKRGGDPSMTWRRRAHAVLGLEGLMAARKCSEEDALKLVKSLYKPGTLRTWRKEISANRKERRADRLFELQVFLLDAHLTRGDQHDGARVPGRLRAVSSSEDCGRPRYEARRRKDN